MNSLILQWKSFKVHLPSLSKKAKEVFNEEFDGISANEGECILFFFNQPSSEGISEIQNYWNSLTEQEENNKFINEISNLDLLKNKVNEILSKSWDSMSLVERKVVAGSSLTKEELNSIINS